MPEQSTKKPTQARGLPAGFGLGGIANTPLVGRKPVQLGDYLDDEPEADRRAVGPRLEENSAADEAAAQRAAGPEPVKPPAPKPKPKRKAGGGGPNTSLPASAKSRFVRSGPPRKQINMRPETLDKARELLWLVQEYGPQPDAKASEMFEALVDLLHDARQRLDLSEVPLRGKWGDETARAFPQHLKAAFAEAIVSHTKPAERWTAKAA